MKKPTPKSATGKKSTGKFQSCINRIERALGQPKRNIMISLVLVCVGMVAILIGNWRSNQARLDQMYGQGLSAAVAFCTQSLTAVFGEDGAGSVDQSWRGIRVLDAELGGWVPIADIHEPIGQTNDGQGGRVVMLVHGLDEPGGIWDQLAPALVADGHTVVRFEYANDQAIAISAGDLIEALPELSALGVSRMDLVCHSMGGLVSHDAMTRDEFAGVGIVVERYVTIGTPHGGSPWARMQAVSEMREQVQRWVESDDLNPKRLLGFARDGVGQAGVDLLPGSDFLKELDSRSMPDGVVTTCIVGRITKEQGDGIGLAVANSMLIDLLGASEASAISDELEKLSKELGDGVVPMSSAVLDGVEDVVILQANHRALIRNVELGEAVRQLGGLPGSDEPPAVAVVLDRLRRD